MTATGSTVGHAVGPHGNPAPGGSDNHGGDIDRALRAIIDEAVTKKAPLVEIIPGKGSGALKKHVLRFLPHRIQCAFTARWGWGATLWRDETGASSTGSEQLAISRCACRSVRDGLSPAGTLDEAKWMPGRISKHSFAVELGRAQTKHVRRRVGDTLDHDVEVHLPRDGRDRPGRRTIVRSELEREPRGRVISRDDHEIVACVGDRVVQERGVEPRECSRVRTVEDDVVQASVHALNGLSRPPQ
jgi:hypothetical protein